MDSIGLFYVGAVLIVNGVMLLGLMTPRAAAPLNLFVGAMQVFTPTYLVMTGAQGPALFGAAGLYLFGFTYLWVGINALADLPGHGLGWFSLFVAVAAVAFAVVNFRDQAPVFGVIWLAWAGLWTLFFLLLGLDRAVLGPLTGAVAIVEGVLTASVPAWLMLNDSFTESWPAAILGAAVGLALIAGIWWLATRRHPSPEPG